MPQDVDASKLSKVKDLPGLLNERVYLALRRAILSMDFAPGEVIRTGPICEALGISRAPLSDALRKLADEGLLDVVPQSGTKVSKLSMREIREASFMREALETAGAGRAAERRGDEQLARLTRNMQMQELLVADEAIDDFYRYDEEFHGLILDCTGISTLKPTIETISLPVQRARLLLLPAPGRSAETYEEHKRIHGAIAAGDAAAAETAMGHHLRQLIRRIEPLEEERPDLFTT
ncbi:MAG: GntR family transcriptional regulator [Silicimonas sp.]|nr:GntR family transcriptional regulator [Silicimonas sp.]